MNVLISSNQSDLEISEEQVKALIKTLLEFKGVDCDELGVHFVNLDTISKLHDQFFNDPTPTDCISVPVDFIDDPNAVPVVLGDIFVCPAVAKSYATEHELSPYDEVTLYIVHGFLHLLGYDDIEEDEQKEMRAEEKNCMLHLEKSRVKLCLVGS